MTRVVSIIITFLIDVFWGGMTAIFAFLQHLKNTDFGLKNMKGHLSERVYISFKSHSRDFGLTGRPIEGFCTS